MSFSFPTEANTNITVATVPLVLTDASKTPRMMTSAEFGLRTLLNLLMNTLEFLYQLLNLKQPLNQVLLGLSVGGHFYKVK